jgi:hypothetical protein
LEEDLREADLEVAEGVVGNWAYLRYNMGMSRNQIERLIQQEVTGRKMVPTIRVDLENETGYIAPQENSVLKRLKENDNGRLIVVKNNKVFEVEVKRK